MPRVVISPIFNSKPMKRLVLLLITILFVTSKPDSFAQRSSSPVQTQNKVEKPNLTEEEKISHLINYVRTLQGSTFIRNGKEFDPGKAADHLQSKYDKHKKRVKTAHDFVDKLASYSKTKEPYQIRMGDGATVPCGELLNKELKRIEG